MKLSPEFVKKEFEKRNCELLTEYTHNTQKLEYICENGHRLTTCYMTFREKNGRCKLCHKEDRRKKQYTVYTHETMKPIFEEKGYTLITQNIYRSTDKVEVICPRGHNHTLAYSQFKKGNGCKKCGYLDRDNGKLTYKFVKSKFEELGYTLLSTDYNNCLEKLDFECDKGHKNSMTYSSIQSGYKCITCSCAKNGLNCRRKYEDIKKAFEKENYILLTTKEEYTGIHQKLRFICDKKHQEHKISWRYFSSMGIRCPYCLHKTEQKCREIISNIMGFPFIKIRPPFLKGLELDCYNEELRLALEYNGIQHYKYTPYFHVNGEIDLLKQKERDIKKQILCKENDIKLIVVPYNIKNLEEYIYNKK